MQNNLTLRNNIGNLAKNIILIKIKEMKRQVSIIKILIELTKYLAMKKKDNYMIMGVLMELIDLKEVKDNFKKGQLQELIFK
jgi:hypothetical protein